MVNLCHVASNASSLRGKPSEEKSSLSRLCNLVLGEHVLFCFGKGIVCFGLSTVFYGTYGTICNGVARCNLARDGII